MKQKNAFDDVRDGEPGTARVIPITAARRRARDGRSAAVEDRLHDFLAFLRRRLAGEYEVDEFGYDREFNDKVLLELIRPLYRRWFRVQAVGLANVPDEAGALVVANHSGTIPVDALMLQVALHDDHPADRKSVV